MKCILFVFLKDTYAQAEACPVPTDRQQKLRQKDSIKHSRGCSVMKMSELNQQARLCNVFDHVQVCAVMRQSLYGNSCIFIEKIFISKDTSMDIYSV